MKKKYLPIIGFGIVFFIGVWVAYTMLDKPRKLKIWNPNELNPSVVDPSMQGVKKNHKIADFKLINQDGDTVTNADFKDRIYVADFFFTTCTNICPKLTEQLERVNKAFKDNPEVGILSHSVTPVIDSVPRLKAYAEKHGAKAPKWDMVTGDKAQIYNLARKSYFAATTKGDGGPEDFIHTENFVLIDKNRRIRGFYNGTQKEDVDRLIEDIHTLLKEYHPND